MNEPLFYIDNLRQFSADGQVYRGFDHLIAARMGTLLLVPIQLVIGAWHLPSGRPSTVFGCQVPCEEVYAVLEYPVVHRLDQRMSHAWNDELQQIERLGLKVLDCEIDRIPTMTNGDEKVLRLIHPCGVRYAVVLG
jgi:hypothetical protein